MVYPNFAPVDPIIIIENNNRILPVMDSNAAEVPGDLVRGRYGATVTTGVAWAEPKTRTGQQYSQISSTHAETVLKEVEETSREVCSHLCQTVTPSATVRAHTCEGGGMPLEGWVTTVQEAQCPQWSEESSVRQISFTKSKAEADMKDKAEVVNDRREKSDVETPDLTRCHKNNITSNKNKDGDTEGDKSDNADEVVEVLEPDVWSDQPASMLEVQSDAMVGHRYVAPNENNQSTSSSNDTQEAPESVVELDQRTPTFLSSEETDAEEPMEPKERDIDLAISGNGNTTENEPTPGNEDAPDEMVSSPLTQRPTLTTRRPTRFMDSNFETQFQPRERKRKCHKFRRKDQTGNNTCAKDPCFRFGGGVKQKSKQREIGKSTESKSTLSDQDRKMTETETQPIKRKRKPKPRPG